jgi:hypothetical protein
MSRSYEVVIRLTDVPEEHLDDALDSLHGYGLDWDEHYELEGRGIVSLAGGISDDDFVKQATYKVWEAVGCFTPVSITLYYIEQTPSEGFLLEEEDYNKWLKKHS